jgi:hypothetical protein
MPDSNLPDRADAASRRRERLDGVLRWVEYVREQPPEVWGAEQNALVDGQLESARATGLGVEHRRSIREFGAEAENAKDA